MAVLVGMLVGAIAGYGLISRLFVWLVARKTRSWKRILSVHSVIGGLLIYSTAISGDNLSTLMMGLAVIAWLAFDLWRAQLSHIKASAST